MQRYSTVRGRLSLAIGAPVGILDATGARSGQPRRTPLLYRALTRVATSHRQLPRPPS